MEWKECIGYENYLVSNEGDIKNKKTGKIRKQKLDKNNYLVINLSRGSRISVVHRQVHRLVAEAFIPNPENKPYIRHKDGNTINNNVDNLEWVTVKEVLQLNNRIIRRGSDVNTSKLSEADVKLCREIYTPKDKYLSCTALAKHFGVSKSTMSYILNKKTYK